MRIVLYSFSILLLILAITLLSPGAPQLEAQSAFATSAPTENASFCTASNQIKKISFSPDGKFVIADWKPGTARVWEVGSGKIVHDFEVYPNATYAPLGGVAFSPDSKYVLVALYTETAMTWEVASGTQLETFSVDDPNHWGLIRTAVYSPNGQYILVGFDLGGRLWNAHTGVFVHDFRFSEKNQLVRSANASFSADGKRILISGGQVILFDVQTGEQLFKSSDLWASLSPDNKYLATYGIFGESTQLWDAQSFTLIRTVKGDFGAFSDHGDYFWTTSATDPADLTLWETKSGARLHDFAKYWRGYFFHNHQYMLTTEPIDSENMRFHVWNFSASSELWNYAVGENRESVVVISPDDNYIAVGNQSGEFRLRDIQTGRVIRKFC